MRFDVITLFPELFAPFLASGVTRRAYESKQVEVVLWNPRDFAEGNYQRVDDRPFGGGPGMVMMAEPLSACLDAALAARGVRRRRSCCSRPSARRCGTRRSSTGRPARARCWSAAATRASTSASSTRASRTRSAWATSCCRAARSPPWRCSTRWRGCSPACWATRPATCRTASIPALDGLLDCPHYTRPEQWQGRPVPAPLMSGHHAQIERWRRDQRLAHHGRAAARTDRRGARRGPPRARPTRPRSKKKL